MPEFDVNEWLEDNGYDTGENASDQLDDYWGNADYNIEALLSVDQMLLADSADPLASSMYEWSLANPEYTGAEFAEEMFNVMWASASSAAQTEFVNTWNNWAADHEDSDNVSIYDNDISGAAAEWGAIYGPTFDSGADFFNPNIDESFIAMNTGMESLINSYNQQYGTTAYQNQIDMLALEEADYENRSEDYTTSMLEQLEGLSIQAGSAKDQYSLLGKKDLSAQAARGLSQKSKGLLSNNLDLKSLRLQLEGMSTSMDASRTMEEQNQELLQLEWQNLLTENFNEWNVNQELAFDDLLLDLDGLVDTFNQAVIGASEEESALLWDQLSAILSSGGITPPTTGDGWDDNDITEQGMCVTTDGNIGVICGMDTGNPGVCVLSLDECLATEDDEFGPDPDAGLDENGCQPGFSWNEETQNCEYTDGIPGPDDDEVDCDLIENMGLPECMPEGDDQTPPDYDIEPPEEEEDFNDFPTTDPDLEDDLDWDPNDEFGDNIS